MLGSTLACLPKAGSPQKSLYPSPPRFRICHTSLSATKSPISRSGKPVYDNHLPARQKAGLKEVHLLRNIDDPNEVVLLFEAEDVQRARDFAASSDLRETMQRSGVVVRPALRLLMPATVEPAAVPRTSFSDGDHEVSGPATPSNRHLCS